MGSRLQTLDLRKTYNERMAVDGVSFDIRPGEFVSLLGPSGCGKTTTLRIIAGLEQADSGRIVIDDRDVTAMPPQQRDIGMVFQHYALFPNLTAFENIAFGLRVRRWKSAAVRQRVDELLELVHLEAAAEKYPHELSGGMQQRVALARALAIAPSLLLLDEPLSALDAEIRESLRTELRRLQRALDITVVYVTHDQAEAMALSDNVIVMHEGALSQAGTPREIYHRPDNAFAARFVGTSNRKRTVLDIRDGKGYVAWGNRWLPVDLAKSERGREVVAVWRPESARMETPATAAGSLHGSIDLITFMGATTRFDVRLSEDDDTVLIDLDSERAAHFPLGASVAIDVPPAAIRLYPVDSAAG